jgi:hypothetical protein
LEECTTHDNGLNVPTVGGVYDLQQWFEPP